MFHKVIRTLWGDLHGEELYKFLLLSLGFFFLIGSFWPLKTLKDGIFINMIGTSYQPIAKMLSLILFFPLVMVYSKLVDRYSKEKMVYLLVSIYGFIGFGFVYLLNDPVIGLQNTNQNPSRLLAWFFFLYIESYISLMVSLFWSFTHDITTPESAKKGYGLIIFGAQLGGFLFTLFGNRLSSDITQYAHRAPFIALVCISSFFLVALVTFMLQHIVTSKNLQSYQEVNNIESHKEEKTSISFLDGLRTLITRPYVAGIFGIIFFHELSSTIMFYQMLVTVKLTYTSPGMINKFMFDYALAIQAVACLFGLIGTSFFQRKFGIRFCIVSYPLLLGTSIVWYLYNPTLQTIFYVMIIAKAINFAFNQPAKEALYIPTTKDIKYKAKAWIDMFGMRFAKTAGSAVNKTIGSIIGLPGIGLLSLIGLWALLAGMLGKKFNKTITEKKLIE